MSVRQSQLDPTAQELFDFIQKYWNDLKLEDSIVDSNFPVFHTGDGELLITKLMIISRRYGVILIAPALLTDKSTSGQIQETIDHLEAINSEVISKLARDKSTRSHQHVVSLIFAPNREKQLTTEFKVIYSTSDFLQYCKAAPNLDLPADSFRQMQAVIELSKGIRQQRRRNLKDTPDATSSMGRLASDAEAEITTFDRHQKEVFTHEIEGPERIKGLAGSGKTVVLAYKAALLHAVYPGKQIAFTFYTKSLHQHITRLITEFHRKVADSDPDWETLQVMHAWGGRYETGFYYQVCREHLIAPLALSEAARMSADPFDYACKQLTKVQLKPMFDYVFVDEGQDFPSSFLRIAKEVTHGGKLVWAYDAFQNIFDVKAPRAEEIFSDLKKEDLLDRTLFKCYRNSTEILVTAHAIGLGIHGEIAQMLDTKEYWEELGYKVSGELKPGQTVTVTRPTENSLQAISKVSSKEEMVRACPFPEIGQEIDFVVKSIAADITVGELLPEDILVVVVDRNAASSYVNAIEQGLKKRNILTNNVYGSNTSARVFVKPNHVTLGTVFRAKGNEAYVVYVVGTDALYTPSPNARSRNLLFTAMTRAKGWVRVTGLGSAAAPWKLEIEKALAETPSMTFVYPTTGARRIMERKLQKGKQDAALEKTYQVLDKLPLEDVERYYAQRKNSESKKEKLYEGKTKKLSVDDALEDLF